MDKHIEEIKINNNDIIDLITKIIKIGNIIIEDSLEIEKNIIKLDIKVSDIDI